ncbi:MAG: response regulator [Melioribacter sp.]|nr:response regulator [Melioribacter sp.]
MSNLIDINTLSYFSRGLKDVFFVINYIDKKEQNYYSENVQDAIGYTSEDLDKLPEKLHSLIDEEDYEIVKKILIDLESDDKKNNAILEYKINTKDGKKIWLREILKVARNEEGIISETHSIIFNITTLRQREIELENINKSLRELNAAKDQFISIVSHDLRAPFTTLLGFSEILLNEKGLSEEERTEYLKYIYEASKTELNLINCLLDWSRLQTGRIKIEPTRLNVKNTIANAITSLIPITVRKNIDVKIDIPSNLYMYADERLISQAVLNLVSNAVRFTPSGKEVNIISQRFKEGMIEIVVIDQGTGIPEEGQSKLFRIDQKFITPGTEGDKGSGLGLMLVKEIIDKHGGQVWFYSELGKGSEFHITVPEAKNLLLIVEDDEAIIALYRKIIEKGMQNFEIKTAANGYEAMTLLKNFMPTVIITDHDMPLMNGVQFVEALYKKDSNRNIPVIIISAKLNDEIIRVYTKLGVNKIITKPIDSEKLINALKECLFQ